MNGTIFAGSGIAGRADGVFGTAQFNSPAGLAVDGDENVLVADCNNHCIRKIAPDGHVATVAGRQKGFVDGSASRARFKFPQAVAVDHLGNVIVGDTGNHCIRKVNAQGRVTTFAGGKKGHDNGDAQDARFQSPTHVAIDGEGNITVMDKHAEYLGTVRRISADGWVSAVGVGFCFPYSLHSSTVDSLGGVFYADGAHVHKVSPAGEHTKFNADLCNYGFGRPGNCLALDGDGNVLISNRWGGIWLIKSCDQPLPEKLCTVPPTVDARGIAVGATGTIYVACSDHRIYAFNARLTPPPHLRSLMRCPSTVTGDLAALFQSGDFADVTFTIDGAQVPAHRALLAARSEYFRAMFQSQCHEADCAVVCVEGTTAAAFRALLQYLYMGAMSLTDGLVAHVMQLSHQYGVVGAYQDCLRYCTEHISLRNAIPWLVAFDQWRLGGPRAQALMFVRQNRREFLRSNRNALDLLSDHPDLQQACRLVERSRGPMILGKRSQRSWTQV